MSPLHNTEVPVFIKDVHYGEDMGCEGIFVAQDKEIYNTEMLQSCRDSSTFNVDNTIIQTSSSGLFSVLSNSHKSLPWCLVVLV